MKKLLRVTFLTGLLTLLKMISGLIIAKAVAIYAGPNGLNMLGQMQSLVTSLNGIASASSGSALVRYTAKNHAQGVEACQPWWRAVTRWMAVLLIFIMLTGVMLSKHLAIWLFYDLSYQWLVVLAFICVPFSVLNVVVSSVLNGYQQYRYYVKLNMIAVVFSTVITLGLVIYGELFGALASASLFGAVSGLCLSFAVCRENWFKLTYWWGTSTSLHMKAVGSYVLMALTSSITSPLSLIFIRAILIEKEGGELAGYWQAVWRVSEVYLGFITLSLATYYLPKLSTLHSKKEVQNEVLHTIKIIMPLVIVLACFVYIVRDFVIVLLFTPSFYPARDLFAVQLLGDVVKIASWLLAYTMLARAATKIFIIGELFFSASFVFFLYFFVSIYGINGANYAYLLNYIFYFLFCFFYIKNKMV